MNPRDYQLEASEKTLDAFQRYRCVLGVAATGLGKTFLAAMIAKPFKDKGRILFVAHQDKLIDQARNTFEGVLGCRSQVEMGEQWADRKVYGEQILFTTPQTQLAGREGGRMTRFDPNEFSLLVVDEVHHHLSPEWLRVIRYYLQNPNLRVFGITATPKRSDKKAMGQLFQHVAFNYDILWGIENGWLVPLHQYPVYVKDLDLSGVRVTAGELNGAELAAKLEDKQIVYEMATPVLENTGDEKTLIFTKTVDQARFFANVLNAAKPGSAEYVAGTTPREYRKPLFERYASGEFQYLVSVNVPREGFDEPGIKHVVHGAPHISLLPYVQKCLDAQTEILSESGWKTIEDEWLPTERAACFNPDGTITWGPVLSKIRRALSPNECFYRMKNPHLDIRVTDGHNMVVRYRRGRARSRTGWYYEIPESVVGKSLDREIPVAGSQTGSGLHLTDDEIRFIGLLLTDGHLNKKNNAITISQAYPEGIAYIEKTLTACGFKYGHSVNVKPSNFGPRQPLHIWWISKGDPLSTQKEKRGWHRLAEYVDRNLSPVMERLDRRQLTILLEAMWIGNGSKQKGVAWNPRTIYIVTARRLLADRIQSLCVRRGMRCNLGFCKTFPNQIRLGISLDRITWSISSSSHDNRPRFQREEPSIRETVWCITVPSGMIVTRRNGKVAILGNCGRGTRPLSGVVDGPATAEARKLAIAASDKPKATIWDFCGNVGRHELCRVVDVLGGKYPADVVARARKNIDKGGKPANIESELKKAEREIEDRRKQQQESERLSQLRIKSSYEVGACVTVSDVLNGFGMTPCWEPPWLKGKYITDAQRGLLMKFGVAVPPDMSLAQATALINELMRRRKEVSPKVKNILVRRGLWRDDMSKREATKLIGQIAEQEGWRKRKVESA